MPYFFFNISPFMLNLAMSCGEVWLADDTMLIEYKFD